MISNAQYLLDVAQLLSTKLDADQILFYPIKSLRLLCGRGEEACIVTPFVELGWSARIRMWQALEDLAERRGHSRCHAQTGADVLLLVRPCDGRPNQ